LQINNSKKILLFYQKNSKLLLYNKNKVLQCIILPRIHDGEIVIYRRKSGYLWI